uniref:Uncharacterized protein n=1 Tax=Setaria viridis TaxID=4556 RepID=A0A4U6UGI6_SETVI|nr:hypothetical protein SEVIR_5G227900v2 [Setaria viridis]
MGKNQDEIFSWLEDSILALEHGFTDFLEQMGKSWCQKNLSWYCNTWTKRFKMLLWPSNSSLTYTSEVMDPDITTISPVNKLHPQDDILATGSSSPFSYGNQRLKMNLQKKGPNRRPRNMYMDQVQGRNQMASLTIVVMTTQMAILAERTRKQRRLVSLTPQKEKANPKSDTWCTSCFSNFDKKSATYQPLLNLCFIFCTVLAPLRC